ncbi:MAG: hypothetical protein ACR2QF_02230 [Geminicoccaceae bacterium]
MSLLTDVWAVWTADVNDPPLPSLDDATDILQADAPTLTDQEGDDWWNAVAAEYDRLGIISGAGTYTQLRAEVNSSGETVSNELFISLQASITILPETSPVEIALLRQSLLDEQGQIPTDITTIETDRDLQSDQVLIDAYNAGIETLERRLDDVNGQLTQEFLS